MLYIQLLLAVGLLSANSVSSVKFQDAMIACAKKLDVDAEKIDLEDAAFLKENKCFLACFLEKKDVFKDDGSIDREMDKEVIKEGVKEEDLKKKYFKAIDDCDVSAKANKCETAYEFVKCKQTKAGVI